ncbi:hypothetical protein Tco_1440979 [Tanacetum coccineum]
MSSPITATITIVTHQPTPFFYMFHEKSKSLLNGFKPIFEVEEYDKLFFLNMKIPNRSVERPPNPYHPPDNHRRPEYATINKHNQHRNRSLDLTQVKKITIILEGWLVTMTSCFSLRAGDDDEGGPTRIKILARKGSAVSSPFQPKALRPQRPCLEPKHSPILTLTAKLSPGVKHKARLTRVSLVPRNQKDLPTKSKGYFTNNIATKNYF